MTTKVRASKFRNMFGKELQLRECYNDIRLGSVSPDANSLQVNDKFIAVPWTGTGTVCVIPLEAKGSAVDEETALIDNEMAITAIKWHPYDDNLLAIACQDGSAKMYRIPDGGLTSNLGEGQEEVVLQASEKRMVFVDFHPLARDVAITQTGEKQVKLWDITNPSQEAQTLPNVFKGFITSVSWNRDGSLMTVSSKDKKIRVIDPRSNEVAQEADDHPAAKGARGVWMHAADKIFSVGFSRTSQRQFATYDPRNFGAGQINLTAIDQCPSLIYPFFDQDINIMYLAGKGDGNIRYYEVDEDGTNIHYLSEYKSGKPQTGIAMMGKRSCNIKGCEIARFYKLTNSQVIPVRFETPRTMTDFFQDDLFPDTWDGQPTANASSWFDGANNAPNKISLNFEA